MSDDALKHWAHVGAPGDTPADGWLPSGLNEFTKPASGIWKFDFDAAQTKVLLDGHRAMEMEDKWHVVTLPTTSPDRVSVEFVRSWTSNPIVRLDLLLTSFGSKVELATWEMDPETVKGASEEFAKGQFIEVARDVLRMPLAPVQLIIHRGDITQIKVDAIVNAANSTLLGGGGVDGAIHRAGGPAILEACRALRTTWYPDGLPAGKAVSTTAGDLAASWVIHTVGPVWSATEDRSETLASCYRESLRVADELGADVVAFPAISAGVYGWPIADAARIAVETVRAAETSVSRVVFALPGAEAIAAFEKAMA